jgi:hypothetical protein
MSGIDTKRTWACALRMSAFGCKADIPTVPAFVAIRVITDIASFFKTHRRARRNLK